METFTEPRQLVATNGYVEERRAVLGDSDQSDLDGPIVDVVQAFAALPHCFTLQACYGHFLTSPGQDEHSVAAIPDGHAGSVRYRIAYIAFCIENSDRGRAFLDRLSRISSADPAYLQLGSADWFWDQWVNSYVLQVEPEAHRFKDQMSLSAGEAVRTERARERFFAELRRVLADESRRWPANGSGG